MVFLVISFYQGLDLSSYQLHRCPNLWYDVYWLVNCNQYSRSERIRNGKRMALIRVVAIFRKRRLLIGCGIWWTWSASPRSTSSGLVWGSEAWLWWIWCHAKCLYEFLPFVFQSAPCFGWMELSFGCVRSFWLNCASQSSGSSSVVSNTIGRHVEKDHIPGWYRRSLTQMERGDSAWTTSGYNLFRQTTQQ